MEEIVDSANQKKGLFEEIFCMGLLPGMARSFPEVIYCIE